MKKRFYVQILAAVLFASSSLALETSGKILLTAGISQVEGAAGGGLTPWAVIGGHGTEDEFGASAFHTSVNTKDFTLDAVGVLVGIYDQIELSYAKQNFNTQQVGPLLNANQNFRLIQNIFGVKVKVLGDAVLEQDSLIPQVAVGVQFKQNEQGSVVKSFGAKDESGYDYYLSATKILLNQSLLYNLTVRATKANQLGILGYGGNKKNDYQVMAEGSLAYLLCQTLAVGVEYRQKPDNLTGIKENDWQDVFLAWSPTKNISLTLAYAQLGEIATQPDQNAFYSSLQVGF